MKEDGGLSMSRFRFIAPRISPRIRGVVSKFALSNKSPEVSGSKNIVCLPGTIRI
jgi:hypothetical protein